MKQWYEALFENYANQYDKECFVQGTAGECDSIEQEINSNKSVKIIDQLVNIMVETSMSDIQGVTPC